MIKITTLFAGYAVALLTAVPCLGQTGAPQSFQLQNGQAIRISPDGKVDVFATMQGDSAHLAKMEKRSKRVTKGLAVWVGPDGKLRYLNNPVEGVEHFGQAQK
jgi:hypothetical protein